MSGCGFYIKEFLLKLKMSFRHGDKPKLLHQGRYNAGEQDQVQEKDRKKEIGGQQTIERQVRPAHVSGSSLLLTEAKNNILSRRNPSVVCKPSVPGWHRHRTQSFIQFFIYTLSQSLATYSLVLIKCWLFDDENSLDAAALGFYSISFQKLKKLVGKMKVKLNYLSEH